MADDIAVSPGTGAKMVANEVTRTNGDAKVQGVELFSTTGAEGSKTAAPFSDTFGINGDAANTTGAAGTAMGLFRGLVTLLASLVALVTAFTDVVNNRLRAEINTLHYSEDSIKTLAEDILPYAEVVTVNTAELLVAAPAAGNHLVIKKFTYQLREDVDCTATIRDGSGGADQHPYDLDFVDGLRIFGKDFGDGGWPLTTATALYGKLSAAPATLGVRFVIDYVIRED